MYTWKNPSSSQVSGLVHSGGMVWEKVFTSPSALAIKKTAVWVRSKLTWKMLIIKLSTCPSVADVDALNLGTNQAWQRSKSFHTSASVKKWKCQLEQTDGLKRDWAGQTYVPWTAPNAIRHKLLVDFHFVGALDDAVLQWDVRRVEALHIVLFLLLRKFSLHTQTALDLARVVVGVLPDEAQVCGARAVVARKEGLAASRSVRWTDVGRRVGWDERWYDKKDLWEYSFCYHHSMHSGRFSLAALLNTYTRQLAYSHGIWFVQAELGPGPGRTAEPAPQLVQKDWRTLWKRRRRTTVCTQCGL